MKKKSDKGCGVSFSPELKEVLGRLKGKEPELDEVVASESGPEEGEECGGEKDDA